LKFAKFNGSVSEFVDGAFEGLFNPLARNAKFAGYFRVSVALCKSFNDRSLQPCQFCSLNQPLYQIPLEDPLKIRFRPLIREKLMPLSKRSISPVSVQKLGVGKVEIAFSDCQQNHSLSPTTISCAFN
jgi:hypothetical protein